MKLSHDYLKLVEPGKSNKFGAIKQEIDGHKFDSKWEAKRYTDLKILQNIGEITHLEVHPKYPIIVDGKLIKTYTADFSYNCTKRAKFIIEDCKSEPTRKKEGWRLTRKLMQALYPSYLLVEVVR